MALGVELQVEALKTENDNLKTENGDLKAELQQQRTEYQVSCTMCLPYSTARCMRRARTSPLARYTP